MEIDGARTLVVGASGALGGALARALGEAGATVVAAGRDEQRTREVADALGTAPRLLDVVDADQVRAAVDGAAEDLGGIDLLVVTVGAPAFGKAIETDAAVGEELWAVNVLGPQAVVRAAAPHLAEGATVVVFSAVLADVPTAGMADYSAAKAGLSAWLDVLRREERKRFRVLDVRPPHLDTGLEGRPLAGTAPRLPDPVPASDVVDAVLRAVREDAREVVATRGGVEVR